METIYDYIEKERDRNYCETIGSENVYIIYNQDSKLTKIGRTKNLNQRFRALVTGSGCDLTLMLSSWTDPAYGENAKWVESSLHSYFKDKRKSGEWFDLSKFDLYRLVLMFEHHFEVINNVWWNNTEREEKMTRRDKRKEEIYGEDWWKMFQI